MSRFWLIEVEEDLAARYTTRHGVWCGLQTVNGVKSVTDLAWISRPTLDAFLLEVVPEATRCPRRRRRGQPELPLDG